MPTGTTGGGGAGVGSGTGPTNDASGCFLWFKADALGINTGNGSQVTYWADLSGSGNNVQYISGSSSQYIPAYYSNVINGYPVVRFSGVNYLQSPTNTNASLQLSSDNLATFCVFSCTGAGTQVLYEDTTNAPGFNATFGIGLNAATGMQIQYGGYPVQTLSEPSAIPLNKFVMTHNVFDTGGTYYFGYFGQNISSGSISLTQNTNNFFTIGNSLVTSNSNFQGDIAEIIAWDVPLSTGQVYEVNQYLYNKYFSVPPSPHYFSPTDISGCFAWYESTSIVGMTGVEGMNIQYWPDSSPSGNNLSVSTANSSTWIFPTLHNKVINGYPTVRFGGVTQNYLQNNDTGNNQLYFNSQEMSLFSVYIPQDNIDQQSICNITDNGNNIVGGAGLNAGSKGGMNFDYTIPTPSTPTGASATFVKYDSITWGNWWDVYGSQMFDINGSPANIPSYATISVVGNLNYTFATNTTDQRAPQPSGGGSTRQDIVWYNASPFTINLNLTDGQSHLLSIYAVDWNNGGRVQQYQIKQSGTGTVLDTRTLSNFTDGKYVQWEVTGNIQINVSKISGANALVNAIFLDPPIPIPQNFTESTSIFNLGETIIRHDRFRSTDNEFMMGLFGVDFASGIVAPFSPSNRIINVGGLPSGNTFSAIPFSGDIAEIIWYNRALSDSETQQVDNYLLNKYQAGANSNIPLYIYSVATSSVSQSIDLYTTSISTLSASSSIDLYTASMSTAESGLSLYTFSTSPVNSSISLYSMAASTIESGISLYTMSTNVIESGLSLYTFSASGYNSSTFLYMYGNSTINNNIPLYLDATTATISSTPLYIGASQFANSGTSLYVYGMGMASSTSTLYTLASQQQFPPITLYVNGITSYNSGISLYTLSLTNNTNNIPLFTAARESGSSPLGLSISGYTPPSYNNSIPLYITTGFGDGLDSSIYNNIPLYLNAGNLFGTMDLYMAAPGADTNPSTAMPLYTSGPTTTGIFLQGIPLSITNNVSGFNTYKKLFIQGLGTLNGGQTYSDNMPLYIGTSPGNQMSLFIGGNDVYTTNFPLYIGDVSQINSGVSLYMNGTILSGNIPLYISGPSLATSGKTLYLQTPPSSVYNSTTMYVRGY